MKTVDEYINSIKNTLKTVVDLLGEIEEGNNKKLNKMQKDIETLSYQIARVESKKEV